MKRTKITVILCLAGALVLFCGVGFGAYMYSKNIPDFNNYEMHICGSDVRVEGYEIRAPFWSQENGKLLDCYNELTHSGFYYAVFISRKYEGKANLNASVEVTSETVTIKFTGTGYNDDGTEDDLARTYIFDVDGAGKNKLPRLINKADIFPEL